MQRPETKQKLPRKNVYTMSDSYVCRFCKEPMNKYAQQVLRCLHEFHKDCIENWMEGTRHCPSCMGYLDSDPSDTEEQPSDGKLQDSTIGSSTNAKRSNVFYTCYLSSDMDTDSEDDLYSDEDMSDDEEQKISTTNSCTVPPNTEEPKGDSAIATTADPSDDDELICPICTEALTSDVKYLWCDHPFHSGCIESWMECARYCPSCMGYV